MRENFQYLGKLLIDCWNVIVGHNLKRWRGSAHLGGHRPSYLTVGPHYKGTLRSKGKVLCVVACLDLSSNASAVLIY